MDQDTLIIKLSNVCFSYGDNHPVLTNLSLDFYQGDRLGLIGPNGSGKTTLFYIIMGLLTPSSGDIEIFGKPAREQKDFIPLRGKIGLLFQDADDFLFQGK